MGFVGAGIAGLAAALSAAEAGAKVILLELRLQDGDYKLGFVDGIAMLLLAARLNQELATTQAQAMTPILSILQALRSEEAQAADLGRTASTADRLFDDLLFKLYIETPLIPHGKSLSSSSL